MRGKTVKNECVRHIFLTLAGTINAFGVTVFLMPVKLIDSGFSGTSMLLAQVTPLALSLWLIILNFPVYLFAMKRLGVKMLISSLYAIAVYSAMSALFQKVFPSIGEGVSPIAGTNLLLASVFGGLISGIGSGLTIRSGGAIDGVEVMSLVFAKKLNLTVGTFVMIFNVILYVVCGILFDSWELPLYSVISYAVGLKAVDFIVDGLDKAKAVMIITENPDLLLKCISSYFGRGITVFEARGYYSDQKKKVVYVVVNRFEISRLKSIVSTVDEGAFVTISEVSDIMGANIKLSKHRRKADLPAEIEAIEEESEAQEMQNAEEPKGGE